MRVGIVAGEKSGDFLGSELIRALRDRYPGAEFVGLCGPLMQQQGAISLAEMEKISIFGLDGLFSSLIEILSIRNKLYRHFQAWQPDVFIGIDVPDFNLALERKLKKRGVPTVHYVSPTVWAWRSGRISKIRASVDLMLVMFPFEEDYYRAQQTPVKYVGHTLAKEILRWSLDQQFHSSLNLADGRVIALLPGSRMSEVSRLAGEMINGARQLALSYPDLHFLIPAANPKIASYLRSALQLDSPKFRIVDGHSRDILALADVAVLASGTAALEAALFATPMVVMYKVSWLSAIVFKRSIRVKHFSMPNHLTDPPVVPELIQQSATAENMVEEVTKLLLDADYYSQQQSALGKIAPKLAADSAKLACDAIDQLLADRKK